MPMLSTKYWVLKLLQGIALISIRDGVRDRELKRTSFAEKNKLKFVPGKF